MHFYETTEIKVAPNKDIVAWRKRFYNGKLDKNPQGPFFAEDICRYTQQTLRTGISKIWKHKYNNATCDVPTDNRSKLSEAHDETVGSIIRAGDVHPFENSAPICSRQPPDTCIGSTDTSISDNNIITNNINKFSTRKRAYPALDVANPKVNHRVDTIPTR